MPYTYDREKIVQAIVYHCISCVCSLGSCPRKKYVVKSYTEKAKFCKEIAQIVFITLKPDSNFGNDLLMICLKHVENPPQQCMGIRDKLPRGAVRAPDASYGTCPVIATGCPSKSCCYTCELVEDASKELPARPPTYAKPNSRQIEKTRNFPTL